MTTPLKIAILVFFLTLSGCRSPHLSSGEGESLFGYALGQSSAIQARRIEAKTQFRAENYNAAFEIFDEILQADNSDTVAWLGYAAAADRLQRFDAADTAYDRLSKLKPGDAVVLNNLGYSHLLRGNVKKAYAYLAQAKALAPSNQRISNNVRLIRTGSKVKAK